MIEARVKRDKAGVTVDRAAAHLKRLGFEILDRGHVFANGADFTIEKDRRTRPVEVKPVRLTGKTWRVDPVQPNRRADALIAMVFPNGHVQVEAMKDHLRLCAKSGVRSMAALAGIYEVGNA